MSFLALVDARLRWARSQVATTAADRHALARQIEWLAAVSTELRRAGG